jgi:hypothetical protein
VIGQDKDQEASELIFGTSWALAMVHWVTVCNDVMKMMIPPYISKHEKEKTK